MDLVGLDCITKSDVQQAIVQAQPKVDVGFIILSDDAPDVATYPNLARFLWLQTSGGVALKRLYYYNGTNWTLLLLLTEDDILAGSITLDKFSLSGASAYNIIQVNAAATGLIFTSIIDAIINGSVPLLKLRSPDVEAGAAGTYVLMGIGSAWILTSMTNLPALFTDNTVPIAKLVRGGASTAGLLLTTSADGTSISWSLFDPVVMLGAESIPIDRLLPMITAGTGPSSAAYQSIRRNSGNNAWEWFTALSTAQVVSLITASTTVVTQALPVDAFSVAQNVVISVLSARTYQAFLECLSNEYGFVAGDLVPLDLFRAGATIYDYFTPVLTANTLTIGLYTGPLAWIRSDTHAAEAQTLDPAKWQFNIRHTY